MFPQAIHILLIEDNPGDARLIREMLAESTSVSFQLTVAERLEIGLRELASGSFDLLLTDLSLPDSAGLETLMRVHALAPAIPIVVMTGDHDETTGIKAVQEGAQDYLVKGRTDSNVLVRTLRYAIERKRAEADLEWERAKLTAILDGMGEGLIYHEESSHSRYINRAMTSMTGYTSQDIAREYQHYLDIFRMVGLSDEDFARLNDRIEDGLLREGIWRGELRLRRKDGTEFDAALTCTPLTALNGRIAGVMTVIRDISQEKELNAQKSRFVANASHELRTPLTNLQTTIYLIRRQPTDLDNHLHKLDTTADRMRGLVEDLLDVSRFERGVIPMARQVVAFGDLIGEVVAMQRAEADRKQIILIAELPPDAIFINADPGRITQVITNLLINAINYTPSRGQIRVSLGINDAGLAEMSIQDSGIGIPPDLLPRIFQPFFRVNDGAIGGTGLGLTITKEIVERHGGQIAAQSTLGKGSTFTVQLERVL